MVGSERSKQAAAATGMDKGLPQPQDPSMEQPLFFFYDAPIQLSGPFFIRHVRGEHALNSAGAACDADMPCPDMDVPEEVGFQELQVSEAQGSKL